MVNQTQTLDAEYSVIGALLLQPQIAGELFAATGEADFVRDELRSVYIAARDIWTAGRQLDPVTIRAAFFVYLSDYMFILLYCCSCASVSSMRFQISSLPCFVCAENGIIVVPGTRSSFSRMSFKFF